MRSGIRTALRIARSLAVLLAALFAGGAPWPKVP
jgi:hypothetical protein